MFFAKICECAFIFYLFDQIFILNMGEKKEVRILITKYLSSSKKQDLKVLKTKYSSLISRLPSLRLSSV